MSFFIFIIQVVYSCKWTDETGYTYNLENLDKPGGWQIKDETSGMGMFSMVYIFNFCDFQQIKCHDKSVAAMEALAVMGQITENCDVAGQVDTQKISHISTSDLSKGILVSYGLGDLCMDVQQQPNGVMQPRQAQFFIECGKDEKEFEVLPDSECIDQFRIHHSAACRAASGSHYLIKAILLIVVYMVGRFIYNRKKLNLEGEEAIPHIEFLRAVAPLIRSKFHAIFAKLQVTYQKYRGTGYGDV